MPDKSLIDYTDEELRKGLRDQAKSTQFSYNDFKEALSERIQDKNTKVLNKWTLVIAIATFVNTLAVLIQLCKALHLF